MLVVRGCLRGEEIVKNHFSHLCSTPAHTTHLHAHFTNFYNTQQHDLCSNSENKLYALKAMPLVITIEQELLWKYDAFRDLYQIQQSYLNDLFVSIPESLFTWM